MSFETIYYLLCNGATANTNIGAVAVCGANVGSLSNYLYGPLAGSNPAARVEFVMPTIVWPPTNPEVIDTITLEANGVGKSGFGICGINITLPGDVFNNCFFNIVALVGPAMCNRQIYPSLPYPLGNVPDIRNVIGFGVLGHTLEVDQGCTGAPTICLPPIFPFFGCVCPADEYTPGPLRVIIESSAPLIFPPGPPGPPGPGPGTGVSGIANSYCCE